MDSRYERKQSAERWTTGWCAVEVYTFRIPSAAGEAARENGISAVKKGAPGAGVKEV